MTPFVCDRDHADARVEARVDVIEPDASPLAFDSGGVWTLRRSADELLFEFRSPRFGAVPYKIGRFRSDFSTGEVVLHRPYFPTARSFYPLEYPLDELIFTNLLSRRNGVELHGCGVVDDDEGLLFLGFSGAGKSTLARLWRRHPGATILSDDRIILRVSRRTRDDARHAVARRRGAGREGAGPVEPSLLPASGTGMRHCARAPARRPWPACLRAVSPHSTARTRLPARWRPSSKPSDSCRARISGSLPMTRPLISFVHCR